MAFKISPQAATAIKERLGQATADATKGIPGAMVRIINKDGDTIFAEASGLRGVSTPEPFTLDSVVFIASCTKMITGIACLQLVEQGLLDLDSAEQVDKLLPELKNRKVLEDSGELAEKKGDITTRMLLIHTAGFGYHLFNEKLRDYALKNDPTMSKQETWPLITNPGTDWNYGFGVDWAGQMVERISGMRLDEYFEKHIFEPLGMKNIAFFLNDFMADNLAKIHNRSPEDGTLAEGDHIMKTTFIPPGPERDGLFLSGGGGLYAAPAEYCELIAALLNSGTHPKTGKQILKPSTVDKMFENQIPQWPNFSRKGIPGAIPFATNPIPELFPQQPHSEPQGWGLTFMLQMHGTPSGRGPGSGSWAGLSNSYYWMDRHNGVGGIVASHILPFCDKKVLDLAYDVEKLMYDGRA